MAKIKTSELIGPALDWAVERCVSGERLVRFHDYYRNLSVALAADPEQYLAGQPDIWVVLSTVGMPETIRAYSTDWSQCGPLMEREGIFPSRYYGAAESRGKVYQATSGCWYRQGPTPLIAAMRCYVASKLGDEVDVPDEILALQSAILIDDGLMSPR